MIKIMKVKRKNKSKFNFLTIINDQNKTINFLQKELEEKKKTISEQNQKIEQLEILIALYRQKEEIQNVSKSIPHNAAYFK